MVSQQGRVLLEADHNEGQRLFTEETRHEALDFVGPCGTPDDGYAITPGVADFTIGAGTMYVGGLRATLEASEQYGQQPDWLDTVEVAPWAEGLWQPPAALAGKFEANLVLREHEVTAVEDPALRDVALGGPDSAGRTRMLQRVVAADTQNSTCAAAAADAGNFWSSHGLVYNPSTAELISRALLQVTPVANAPVPSPCDPPSASGYLGADNQLMRVQIVAFDAATGSGVLLWGYYNASTLYRCTVQTASTVKLATRPVSAEYQPRSGQVVQALQRAADLGEGAFAAAMTGHFAKLNASYAPDTQIVTLPGPMPQPPYANGSEIYLRLWEDQSNFTLGNPVVLVSTGLQVTITAGSAGPLHIGDHWSFALRPLTPNKVYPERLLASPQSPDGPRMWACPLAVMQGGHGFQVLENCRLPFDNLVELTARKSDGCCCVKVSASQANELQRTIDQATAGGAAKVVIHLEAGTYTLRKPLIVTAKHRGVWIEACTGAKVILRAGDSNNPDFFYGLILAMEGAELGLRGLDFQIPNAQPPKDLLQQVIKKDLPKLDWIPNSVCFGVRALYCDSLQIEDCSFQFPAVEKAYGAAVLVQGDTSSLIVRRCGFFGQPGPVPSAFTGVLALPFVLSAGDMVLRPTSINVCRIEDCLFGFLVFGSLLAGEIRYAWVAKNVSRSVYGGLFLFSLSPKLRLPSEVMAVAPWKSANVNVKKVVEELMATPLVARVLGVGMAMGSGSLANRIKSTPQEKALTLGEKAVGGKFQPVVTPGGQPLPLLCLTLEGNQFDCRPLAGDLESSCGIFIWDTNTLSCFANVTGNTIWNRSSAMPSVLMVTLDGFNVTGNVVVNDIPEQSHGGGPSARNALWVQPGHPVASMKNIPHNMMTITGNTIFGRTNLGDWARKEWPGLPPGVDTWEFFNTVAS